MWDEFKIFLYKSLEENRVFVDTIKHKMRTASYHQLEDIINWEAHLKHLQTAPKEYDTTTTLLNKLLI